MYKQWKLYMIKYNPPVGNEKNCNKEPMTWGQKVATSNIWHWKSANHLFFFFFFYNSLDEIMHVLHSSHTK